MSRTYRKLNLSSIIYDQGKINYINRNFILSFTIKKIIKTKFSFFISEKKIFLNSCICAIYSIGEGLYGHVWVGYTAH